MQGTFEPLLLVLHAIDRLEVRNLGLLPGRFQMPTCREMCNLQGQMDLAALIL